MANLLRDTLIFGTLAAIVMLAFRAFYLGWLIHPDTILGAWIQGIMGAYIVFWFIEKKPGEAEAGKSAAGYAKAEVKKYNFFDKLRLISIWRKLALVGIVVAAIICFLQPGLDIWSLVIGGIVFIGLAWYIIEDGFYGSIYLKKKKELMNKK